MPSLRACGAVPPPYHMQSWHGAQLITGAPFMLHIFRNETSDYASMHRAKTVTTV